MVEAIIKERGLELVDLEQSGAAGAPQLRVVLDTEAGDGRVPVTACAEIARELSLHLEAQPQAPPPFSARARLEVSSPGLHRPLSREKDFAAACGREISLQTRAPIQGRRRFRGRLCAFARGQLQLQVDGENYAVPLAEVAKARALYNFTPQDFTAQRAQHQRRETQ